LLVEEVALVILQMEEQEEAAQAKMEVATPRVKTI